MSSKAKLWGRLAVEGWSTVFVTHAGMEKTLPDGRVQKVGLQLAGIACKVSVDLANARMDADGFSARITDPVGSRARAITAALATEPTAICSLTADLSSSATSMTVDSTADFASSGVIHIGTEAIAYSGKTATAFTGLTRGTWGTIAQKHVVPTGEGRYYPEVTDIPRAMRGRRAYLYIYTDGPTAVADANPDPSDSDIFWRGRVSSRSFSGGEWKIGVEPVNAVLDQPIGSDFESDPPIRGIYYPPSSPFVFCLRRLTGATPGSAVTSDVFDGYWASSTSTADRAICVVGFFETQRAFLDELQTQLDARISGWSLDADAALTFEETEDGFQLRYRTGGTTAHWIAIANILPISRLDHLVPEDAALIWADASGAAVASMSTASTYYLRWRSPVPRGAIGRDDARREAIQYANPTGLGSFDSRRIYLGGDIVPTTSMLVEVETPELGDDGGGRSILERVLSVNASSRYLVLSLSRPWSFDLLVLGPATRLKLARLLATGTVEDFRSGLVTNSPELHTSGGSPLVSGDDFPSWSAEATAAAEGLRFAQGRRYITREGVSLLDLLTEEYKLLGLFPTLDTQGRYVLKRLKLAAATDTAAFALTSSTSVGEMPGYEPNAYNTLGKIVYRTGYNSKTDEHEGRTYEARNLRAISMNPSAGTIEVAPLSEPESIPEDGETMDPRDVVVASSRVLGIFGAPHFYLTVKADWSLRTARPGDIISVTTSLIPNASGTMGLSARPGIVTEVKIDLDSGVVTLQLLMTQLNIAGYAPGYRVTSSAVVTGTQYDITLSYADYGSAAPGDVLAVGDAIEVWQRNTRTPSSVTGTVDSVTSGSAVVRCTLSGAIPSGSLAFGYGSATAVQASQEIYAFEAGSDRRIDFSSGTVRGRVYAP